MVFWLHTARTENPFLPPKHIQAPPFSMNTTRIPQTSHRHSQDICREHDMPTDANRHRQTPQDTDRCCLSMSGGFDWPLLFSVCMLCSLEMAGGCLWDVWGVSGGVWGYLSGIRGNRRRLDVFWGVSGFSVPAAWSQSTILAQP